MDTSGSTVLQARPTGTIGWKVEKGSTAPNKQDLVVAHSITARKTVSKGVPLYTTPGQSMRKMRFMSVMYCQTFVSPGTGATLHTCGVAEPDHAHYTPDGVLA
jgi:signal recognition particle receptor subunit beta